MKAYYQCEKCGAKYDTPAEAEACEIQHAKKEEERRAEAEEKKGMENAISELISKYYDKYGKLPTIKIGNNKYFYARDYNLPSFWF